MSGYPFFGHEAMMCSSRDHYGNRKLAIFTKDGFFEGNTERFERQRDENLADYNLAKRPPWRRKRDYE